MIASVISLVPFSLADIFQTASLIFQSNGFVHQCFKIRKSVHDQLAFKRGRQTVKEFLHLLDFSHTLLIGVAG